MERQEWTNVIIPTRVLNLRRVTTNAVLRMQLNAINSMVMVHLPILPSNTDDSSTELVSLIRRVYAADEEEPCVDVRVLDVKSIHQVGYAMSASLNRSETKGVPVVLKRVFDEVWPVLAKRERDEMMAMMDVLCSVASSDIGQKVYYLNKALVAVEQICDVDMKLVVLLAGELGKVNKYQSKDILFKFLPNRLLKLLPT